MLVRSDARMNIPDGASTTFINANPVSRQVGVASVRAPFPWAGLLDYLRVRATTDL